TQEVPINGRTEFEIEMVSQAITGEEMVVVGYGAVEKRDLTGSVSSVGSDEVTSVPSANVMQALKGRAAGVRVKQNNGHPGGNVSIRIRGSNSIVGNNEPLYIVDGFPVDDPESINNSSIESIEILKDASAVAIYGSRASNGVVLISTNSGRSGATEVNFESSIGNQRLIKSIEMMHPLEFGEYYNVLENNMVGEDRFSQEELDEFATLGKGTVWEDIVYRTAPIYNNSLNVRGGNDQTQFSITGSAFNQEGIIRNSDYNRYAIDSKIQHDVSDRFSVDASITLSRIGTQQQNSEQGRFGTSLIGRAHGIPNYIPAYDENGNRVEPVLVDDRVSEALWHPNNYLEERERTQKRNNVLVNAGVSYEFIDGLVLNIDGGVESKNTRNDFYQTKDFQNDPNGSASVSTNEYISRLLETTLNYNGAIGENHDISAVGGVTFQDFRTESLSGSGSNFLSDIPGSHSLATAGIPGTPNTSFTESTILSGLGRINYILHDRYLFTVSMRADGSSVYTEGNKWGYFPSAAFSWRLSDEEFINLDNTIINELKLRTSWGLAGSQAISAYSTLNRLNPGSTVLGNSLVTTMAPGSRLASDLKWETTEALNFGLDISIYDDRVSFIADYYIKETRDLLNAVQLARSTGYTNSLRNIGRIENRGFEFAVNSYLFSSSDFNWNLDANISFNRSKVKELYGGQDILGGQLSMIMFTDWANTYREGEPRGIMYGYKEDGYDEDGYLQYTTEVGDKVKIGDPNPNFIFGINSDMSYRNFTLSMFIDGSQGNDIINMSKVAFTTDHTNGTNKLRDIVGNYWTPENPDAKYIKPSRNHDFRFSDRYVEDGSYIRLSNIELAYNIPNELVSGMRHAQVYISGQNLLTITNYSWIDPDVNTRGGPSSLAQGIDYASYPSAKSFTAGIRLGF
ncbi:TonB-linked outer membrane protein, SusC/RagA family, partial [Fodinibius roseus]